MSERIFTVDRLVKRYESRPVLKGITAAVERGDVVGLLGLNGAG
jgi:ABC-type multidrug transport system ATPase subunit